MNTENKKKYKIKSEKDKIKKIKEMFENKCCLDKLL